jgi:predicted transcriptional regulator of viral defense system
VLCIAFEEIEKQCGVVFVKRNFSKQEKDPMMLVRTCKNNLHHHLNIFTALWYNVQCECSKVVITLDKNTIILEMIEKNNGFITSAKVTEAGLQRRILSELVAADKIVRLERGIYVLPHVWEDEMYFLQYRYSKGIFSNETALYLHGLSDRTPQAYTLTIPRKYNVQGMKKKNVKVKFVTDEIYGIGIMEMPSPLGNPIRVYDKERTLCDIVKGNNSYDIQLVNQAMKAYAVLPDRDMAKLLGYAERLRVKPKILRYMEVLL